MRVLVERSAVERADEEPDRCVACTRTGVEVETRVVADAGRVGLCVDATACRLAAREAGIHCVYP